MKDTRASRRVPCHKTRGILEQMMKTALLILACALLTACASSRYVAVQPAGGGGYYIAQTPACFESNALPGRLLQPLLRLRPVSMVELHLLTARISIRITLRCPIRPGPTMAVASEVGTVATATATATATAGFGGHPYGFASHGDYPPGLLPARTPVVPAAVPPAPVAPARVVAPTVVREGRERNMDTWNRHRGFTQPRSAKFQPAEPYLAPRHKPFATSPSTAPAIRSFDSVGRPSLPSYSPPPPTGSSPGGLGRAAGRAGQALDRSPLEHHP